MILQDLFEGRMKDIDIEYQDFLRSRGRNAMTDKQFQDAYGMTRIEWAKKNRHWTQQKERRPVAPDAHLFHEGVEDYAGLYSPEAIALGKKFCDFYNITEDTDIQLAVEIIDSYLDEFKQNGQPIDLRVIKSGVVDAFRQVYRGMGPGPNFRKKFQNRLDEKQLSEENQDDRNARIIAGEIEDAAQQGNDELVKQKIKELIRVGYTLDKDGNLQRMGMYEEDLAEGVMKDLHTELADKYQELAPKIERHRDSYLAGELYDALEEIASQHGAMAEFRRMMNGARNRAHMDYDTNPGGFQNWFWYLPFADEQLDEKQDACYRKVKSRYKVWPSAYASGALVQCRKKGAANWGNKSKK
jgi:hypothetical protein